MRIPFSKYSGCGNDFILIDNREDFFDEQNPQLIARLCHRRLGIGADGLILLKKSLRADFRMRIFNADGGEAEMCGNGIRCLTRFIHDLNISGQSFLIETMFQQAHVSLSKDLVSVKLPNPSEIHFSSTIPVDGRSLTIHFLDTGVPHAVIFVDNLEDDSLMKLAPKIRSHRHFKSKGANVDFAKISSDGTVSIRTYERGVEGETLACGTGAVATAIAAAHVHGLQSPVTINPRSKEPLQISFTGTAQAPENLTMTGPATKVYEGHFLKDFD